jgi:hypothetical protein
MKSARRKRPHETAIRTSVTLNPVVFSAGRELVRKHGYNGLSDYFSARIRKDAGLEPEENNKAVA